MKFRTVALGVSITVHALLFVHFQSESFQGEKKIAKREIVTRVGFVNLGTDNNEEPVVEEKVVEKTPPPEPIEEKPVIKDVAKHVLPKKVKNIEKNVEKSQKEPVFEEKRTVSAMSASQKVEVGSVDQEAEEERYLRELIATIEKNKFYPKSAKRRRIEGGVKVSFLIHHNGEMEALEVSGKAILCKAAKEAIRRSLPLPPPVGLMNCPIKVEYEMVYALK